MQAAITELINNRFDHVQSGVAEPIPSTESPATNGYKPAKKEGAVKQESTPPSSRAASSPPPKTEPDSEEEEEASPPKKKRKQGKEADDAKLAAKLQAEFNQTARATRGGNKKVTKKVPKKPRKKSEKKIKADDDSGLEEVGSDGEVKEKPKKGGFHKQYYLSHPLVELVGETKVSSSCTGYFISYGLELTSRSCLALKSSRKYGSISRHTICKTQPTSARFGAMRSFSLFSRRIGCICSQ